MKFTIDAKPLSVAATQVKGAAGIAQRALPILSGLLIEASGKSVSLTSTDLIIRLTLTLDASVTEEGSALIPGARFADAVALMEGDVLVDTDATKAVITSNEQRLQLQLLPTDEFPPAPKEEKKTLTVTVPSSRFGKWLRKLMPFMATAGRGTPIRESVYFTSDEGKLMLVAVEGRYLGVISTDIEAPKGLSAIVPAAAVQILSRLGDAGDSVRLKISEQSLTAESDTWTLSTVLLEGAFANWKNVLPDDSAKKIEIGVPLQHALSALRFASVAVDSRNPKIVVRAQGKEVAIESRDGDGNTSSKSVRRTAGSKDLAFSVAPQPFRAVLAACESENVTLQLTDKISPFVIRDGEFLSVVSPMRTEP